MRQHLPSRNTHKRFHWNVKGICYNVSIAMYWTLSLILKLYYSSPESLNMQMFLTFSGTCTTMA